MKIIIKKESIAHAVPVAIIILFALLLRILLMSLGWPSTDSDEGLIGLQAMHIAYLGEHPTFLYDQYYMGTIQPYLASVLFHLFGISSFTLRLSTLILFGCFLLGMYLLTRLLYTRNMALFVLVLLSLGTQFMLTPQMMVEGGIVETLLFASILMLISTWLALTATRDRTRRRLVLYACWGLVAGAAIWSDYLIAPWLLGASFLLVFFCWHTWRKAEMACLLIGFIIGALPIIIYNLHPAPGQNFFQVIWSLQHATPPGTTISTVVRQKQFVGTFLYGLPMMSGLTPVCSLNNMPVFTPMNAQTTLCTLFNGSWALGYVMLLLLAALLSTLALLDLRRLHRSQPDAWTPEKRRIAILHMARLMLLVAAVLTIALYGLSPVSGQRPWSTRYLTALLVATPAILSLLWNRKNSVSLLPQRFLLRFGNALNIFKNILIALILLSFLASTVMIAQVVPDAMASDQNENQLISDLLGKHITHIYSEYWTCGRITFQSQEKIICAVVNNQIQVNHNRYEPYAQTVVADTRAAYIFPTDTAYVKACAKKLAGSSLHYQRFVIDNYVVFSPA